MNGCQSIKEVIRPFGDEMFVSLPEVNICTIDVLAASIVSTEFEIPLHITTTKLGATGI